MNSRAMTFVNSRSSFYWPSPHSQEGKTAQQFHQRRWSLLTSYALGVPKLDPQLGAQFLNAQICPPAEWGAFGKHGVWALSTDESKRRAQSGLQQHT